MSEMSSVTTAVRAPRASTDGAVLVMTLDGAREMRVLKGPALAALWSERSTPASMADALERASHSIRRRGFGPTSLAVLVRSAELTPALPDRARRFADAAFVGASIGGDLGATDALLSAAQDAASGARLPVEVAVAAAYKLMCEDGDVATACRPLLRALRELDVLEAGPLSAEAAMRTLVWVCHYAGRPELWEALRRHAARLGTSVPEDVRLDVALGADPLASPSWVLDQLGASVERLPLTRDPLEVVRVAGLAAYVDRLTDCRQALRRAARETARDGADVVGVHAHSLLALETYLTGQWDETEQEVQAAVDVCEARDLPLLRRNAQTALSFVAAARGEVDRVRTMADEVIRWAQPRGAWHLQAGAYYARTQAALAVSDFEGAYADAVRISRPGELTAHELYAPWLVLDLVEAALRTGRESEARAHVEATGEAGVAALSPRLAMLAGAAAALLAPDDEACGLFEAALALHGVERWPFDLARVGLLYGERLRRARRVRESRLCLLAAWETFRRLGAPTWAERAAHELRAAGHVDTRAVDRGPDALTPQELEIAMLAAAGLTNKQIGLQLFLSHRTVGSHLCAVFRKLRIASRAALRDALTATVATS